MLQKEKYYFPTTEEFHVEFQFELFLNNEWYDKMELTNYEGSIKNKSELEILLKQLGIL